MMSGRVSGTEGYADEAEDLLQRYERISFADAIRRVAHLIPATPSDILDIGAGTGRDAAGFAALGHRVVAAEPTPELRHGAMALHSSPLIEWVDDHLPELSLLLSRGQAFDVVMLSAVWMHLDEHQRRQGMPNVASLVRPGGTMLMSLRHGPVPPGRRMFEVGAEETIGLARGTGLEPILNVTAPSVQSQPGITWTRLGFRKSM